MKKLIMMMMLCLLVRGSLAQSLQPGRVEAQSGSGKFTNAFKLTAFITAPAGNEVRLDSEVLRNGQYKADWDSLKRHNAAPEWFRDAKFGIYFHWGVYSVPAFGNEWYPRNMHIRKRREYKHHIDTYGEPNEFGYHDFAAMFKAEKFNADEWAELFKRAGARFAGPVAEHHDGFSMWDSELTPWNAADMGPKRDIAGELAAAIRKRGMRFITSFHHARNRRWYPRVQGWPTTSDEPKLQMLYGNMPEQQFNEMWLAKLTEVIDSYRPDLMWFDSRMDLIPDKYRTDFLAYYFNKAEEWDKEVVVTYKEQCLPREIGVEDFEKGRMNRITEYAWLTDDTISLGSWGYTHNLKIKSTRYVLGVLIDIVSKNGQLLLNISPKADGSIPMNQRRVLLGIGEWLGINGEAIYGTRPFVVFGEGPTRLKTGGEFAREKLLYKPADIRFTKKGNFVYAIQLGWPGAKHETLLKSFSGKRRQESLKIKSVRMLGSDEKITWSLREHGLAVTSPLSAPDKMAVVYKIETNGIENFKADSPANSGQTKAEALVSGRDIELEIAEDGTLLDKEVEDDDDDEWTYPADEFPVGDIDLSKVKIVVLNPESKIQSNAADMLKDEIKKRTRIGPEVVTSVPAKGVPAVVIGVGKQVTKKYPLPAGLELPGKADGYAVWIDRDKRAAVTICLAGVDERGALFAAGRLLRILKMSRDRVGIDDGVKIATAPKYSLRGHQLGYRPKTNSYDGWDIEMWEQYYRDMIAFGMNAVELIPPRSDDEPDSPHFPLPKLEMMVQMSRLADEYGLDVWIWYPIVGGDGGDSESFDAIETEAVEVCSKLPRIDAVFVPGGDPGDIHPGKLLPLIKKLKEVLNRYHPKATVWISPQNFDRKGEGRDGWYKDFIDILNNDRPAWLDGVVFGPTVPVSLPDLRKDVPVKYPIRRYPDITHCTSCPYAIYNLDRAYDETLGREPINPRPRAYAGICRDLMKYSIGFISYSEGCNDDLNKVLWSCLGWDPQMKVERILREYSRYFISPRYEKSLVRGLLGLERNLLGPLIKNEGVYETLELFRDMEKKALPGELLNWRFQQLLYRAYYDAYIKARLDYESELEKRALEVLGRANQTGAISALDKAEAILDKAQMVKVKPEFRARVFELAEALFQSVRMQLSVKKHHSQRYGNLDDIDEPVSDCEDLKDDLDDIHELSSPMYIGGIRKIKDEYSSRLKEVSKKSVPADWPDWRPAFDEYQRKRSGLYININKDI